MLDILLERIRQKRRTVGYPQAAPALPPHFRGRPFIDAARCDGADGKACRLCADGCPTGAIRMEDGAPALDMGMCIFCGACASACPRDALVFTNDWRLASTDRDALVVRPHEYAPGETATVVQTFPPFPARENRTFSLPELPITPTNAAGGTFRKSLRLRQVTAAGCGACEADLNVLSTVVFDIGRFGMDFVASPRHADALILTGPVPDNMREAFFKCHAAMPGPKLLVAVGACAISGGLFRTREPQEEGAKRLQTVRDVPVSSQNADGVMPCMIPDLYVPGCPPHPYTTLDGLLRLVGRL